MADDELGWKQLEKLPEQLRAFAHRAVKDVTFEFAERVYLNLVENTPKRTGGLVASLRLEEVNDAKRVGQQVGYKVYYDKYDEKERPYQEIANSLNRGWYLPNGTYVPGTYYMDRAVSSLRGMDKKIDEVFEKYLEKIDLGEK